MNYMAFYGGHDCAFCFYESEKDKFFTIEVEKLTGVKHFQWAPSTKESQIYSKNYNYIMMLLAKEMVKNDIPFKFDVVLLGSYWASLKHQKDSQTLLDPQLLKEIGITYNNIEYHQGHHLAHIWSAIGQLPPEKAAFITSDGGGDDAFFTMGSYDRTKKTFKRIVQTQDKKYKIGGHIETAGHNNLDSLCQNTPNAADLPGKIMGAAAFGSTEGVVFEKKLWQKKSRVINSTPNHNYNKAVSYYGEQNRFRFGNKNHLTFQEECNLCAVIQQNCEDQFENAYNTLFPEDFEGFLAKFDYQLVISGGVALNITNNMKLQKRLGCDIWVPPNPGDNGLAFGMLYSWLINNKHLKFNTDKRYDNSFIGPKVSDMDMIDDHKAVYRGRCHTVSLQDVSDMLKSGKVIALMQGNSETGFRALGNRSILCDASFPDIKTKVNDIKRREKYRPFAPVCLWEDASKWFVVGNVNNYKHMNISVEVKEEAQAAVAAVTHVDNTARLQAVEDDGFLRDLLTLHRGVLLNTSFNLGGKPICNTLFEALHILERSNLDNLVVHNHFTNELLCFTHHR